MSSIYTSDVQLGVLPTAGTIYTMNVQLGTRPTHNEISTGAFNVTAEAGVTVSGLTIGKYYSIEATGGPWNNGSGIPGQEYEYEFAVSNDGGSSWSGHMGWTDWDDKFYKDNPAWSSGLAVLDAYRARMYWRATTTSIKIRVGDAAGMFGDNSGSLGWALKEGLSIFTSGVRLG